MKEKNLEMYYPEKFSFTINSDQSLTKNGPLIFNFDLTLDPPKKISKMPFCLLHLPQNGKFVIQNIFPKKILNRPGIN